MRSERLAGRDAEAARAELLRICHEYRVSWSLGVRAVELASAPPPARQSAAPTRDEILRLVGAPVEEDLAPGTMARAWVRAVLAAQDAGDITRPRADEMARLATPA